MSEKQKMHLTGTTNRTILTLPIETTNQPLTDSLNLVVISPFANAAAALDYTRKTAEIAETRIIPWMPKGKFSFLVITQANLQLLQTRKDLSEYLRFHGQAYSWAKKFVCSADNEFISPNQKH